MENCSTNCSTKSTRNSWRTLLLTSSLLLAAQAQADVIFSETFESGSGSFSEQGRVYSDSNGVLLRGGSSAGMIYSPSIAVAGFESLTISYDRATSGLDLGETIDVLLTVDGASPQILESVRSASGNISWPIPDGTNNVAIAFELDANSFFDSVTIGNVVVEGSTTGGCQEDCCGPNCPPQPGPDGVTIYPDASWDCGLPNGIADPSTGNLLFSATLAGGNPLSVGQTQYGQRTVVPTFGGNIQQSSALNGEILTGALDFDLQLPSGAREFESRYTIETNDGTLIYMRNCGVADLDNNIRFVADFEAPNNSAYASLNSGTYIGVREVVNGDVVLNVYENTNTNTETGYAVPSDNNLPQQSFNCPAIDPNANQGREVIQAFVGIGGFQTIGDSKYGERRIVPITGGSFSGDFDGDVNPGGSDFQLTVNGDLSLEARYTLLTDDGELIVVRNCGNYGVADLTLPLFETRVNGPYSYLNNSDFVGTITPLFTSVIITVYEEQ